VAARGATRLWARQAESVLRASHVFDLDSLQKPIADLASDYFLFAYEGIDLQSLTNNLAARQMNLETAVT
jgi:hypothetical protein